MVRPAVTVLIPTFNRAQFLPECLDSVLGQTLPPAQLLVVNDGSTDNTSSILATYRDRVEYIETQNLGKPTVLNMAMAQVHGDYIWIFDDDDVALPDALERFVRALDQRPDCGFAYSNFYISKTRREDGRIEPERSFQIPNINEENFLTRLMEASFLCGAGIFVRTSCYREVGPFREDLFRSQDYEMAVRLSRKYRGVRVDSPTFHYRQHEGLRGWSLDRFSWRRKAEKWREYDGKFFRELRQVLDLREYLPRSLGTVELKSEDTRRAYLQRMTIMASKGLYDEMIEDLRLALAQKAESPALSDSERHLITRATSYAAADDTLFTGSIVLPKVKALCRRSALGREVQFEFLRGLYWRAAYSWKVRSFRHALQFLLAFVRLGGYRGIVRSLQYKLPRPPKNNVDSAQNH